MLLGYSLAGFSGMTGLVKSKGSGNSARRMLRAARALLKGDGATECHKAAISLSGFSHRMFHAGSKNRIHGSQRRANEVEYDQYLRTYNNDGSNSGTRNFIYNKDYS